MFINNLRVESIKNKGKTWVLIDELHYEHKVHGTVKVPMHFETDFASVPRVPVLFELVGNRGQTAATVHDYLYSTKQFTRKEADKIFLQALRDTRVGKVRSYLMYYGVRLFGWKYFNK